MSGSMGCMARLYLATINKVTGLRRPTETCPACLERWAPAGLNVYACLITTAAPGATELPTQPGTLNKPTGAKTRLLLLSNSFPLFQAKFLHACRGSLSLSLPLSLSLSLSHTFSHSLLKLLYITAVELSKHLNNLH